MPADESPLSSASSPRQSAGGGSGLSRSETQVQADIARLVREALSDLERKKRSLELEVEKLERRRDRIEAEMKTSFAGASQDLAVRVQSFKEYLVGSLQDLVTSAEQLSLSVPEPPTARPATAPSLVEPAPPAPPQRRPVHRTYWMRSVFRACWISIACGQIITVLCGNSGARLSRSTLIASPTGYSSKGGEVQ